MNEKLDNMHKMTNWWKQAWASILNLTVAMRINSQSLEDTQVGYISQKYTLDKYTLERASSPVHHPRCITPGASPPVHHLRCITPGASLPVHHPRCITNGRATRDWKFESVTNQPTYRQTDIRTWVGARDSCVSRDNTAVDKYF